MAVSERPGCLSAILRVFRGSAPTTGPLPYRVRDDFLSAAEYAFYHVLRSATQATICPKVRLADIFYVARPNENISYLNRITSKHIDFLLCNPASMKPLLGIELDDSSHSRSARKERDDFVDKAFAAASLPLLRVSVQRTYNVQEIQTQIAVIFNEQRGEEPLSAEPVIREPLKPQANVPPMCPKCGVPMVVRVASKGDRQGEKFYGCQNYPICRELLTFSQG